MFDRVIDMGACAKAKQPDQHPTVPERDTELQSFAPVLAASVVIGSVAPASAKRWTAGLCEQEQAENTTNNAPLCNQPQPLQLRARFDRHDCPLARNPIDAIQLRMQQSGIDRVLAATSGRVSEILNRRRRLKIDAVRRLADALNLSERCLLQPCQLAPRKPGSPADARRGGLAP